MTDDNSDMSRNQQELQKALKEIIMEVEHVGEKTAKDIAHMISVEAGNLEHAFELLANDEQLQEDLKDIPHVGEQTVTNLVHFAEDMLLLGEDVAKLVGDVGGVLARAGGDVTQAHVDGENPVADEGSEDKDNL